MEETAKNSKVGVVRLVQSNHGTQPDKLSAFCRTKHTRIIVKVHGSECISGTVAGLRPEWHRLTARIPTSGQTEITSRQFRW